MTPRQPEKQFHRSETGKRYCTRERGRERERERRGRERKRLHKRERERERNVFHASLASKTISRRGKKTKIQKGGLFSSFVVPILETKYATDRRAWGGGGGGGGGERNRDRERGGERE